MGSFVRLDPAFDSLVPSDAQVERLASGYLFTEGPLWRPSGVLWFSDIIGNVVRQWSPDGTVVEVLRPGGYDGSTLPVPKDMNSVRITLNARDLYDLEFFAIRKLNVRLVRCVTDVPAENLRETFTHATGLAVSL